MPHLTADRAATARLRPELVVALATGGIAVLAATPARPLLVHAMDGTAWHRMAVSWVGWALMVAAFVVAPALAGGARCGVDDVARWGLVGSLTVAGDALGHAVVPPGLPVPALGAVAAGGVLLVLAARPTAATRLPLAAGWPPMAAMHLTGLAAPAELAVYGGVMALGCRGDRTALALGGAALVALGTALAVP